MQEGKEVEEGSHPAIARWFQAGTYEGLVDIRDRSDDKALKAMGAAVSSEALVLEEGRAPSLNAGIFGILSGLVTGYFFIVRRFFAKEGSGSERPAGS